MMSYRFRRRAFLAASGGLGLKIMFRNLEVAAQTTKSPPRFLLTHWPVGIVAGSNDSLWAPTSGSATGSQALQPFVMNGLDGDLTVFRGIAISQLSSGGCAGSHEGGTPKMTTGLNLVPGCRASDSEGDDGVAGGPSIDQILLKNAPALQSPLGGQGFANAICDSRVDTAEIGAQCLSYGYTQEPVQNDSHQTIQQNHPNMPTLSPLNLYNALFMNFVPVGGGGGGGVATGDGGTGTSSDARLIKQLAMRKSVLDFALAEVTTMGAMAPKVAAGRLMAHADAIRNMESTLTASIQNIGTPTGPGDAGSMSMGDAGAVNMACSTVPAAPANITGSSGSPGNMYSRGIDMGSNDDTPIHQQVAQLHMGVLQAAMLCDIIRVGSFQFSPGTNHVSLKGFFPGNPTGLFQHHPVSHRIGTADTVASSTVAGFPTPEAGFLFNVMTWYFGLHAANLAKWKSAIDGFGNSLLDYTCVPFITEVMATGHEQTNMAGMIIGGKKLGFVGNQYFKGSWTVNQYFGTLAQAFGVTSSGVGAGVVGAPIAGVWKMPA